MRYYQIAASVLAVLLPGISFAMQPAVIDLNAKANPMTKVEYSDMLACTLEKHPETTRRYAEYHLQRRNVQTWQENEKDPDVDLFLPSLDGCFEIEIGKPFPFSLDQLVGDWGRAHDISSYSAGPISDMKSLANCAAQYNPSFAQAYLQMAAVPSTRQAKNMNMLLRAMTMTPPCTVNGDIEVRHNKFVKLLNKAFDAQKAGK